jgi:hypothetical protein
VLSRLEREFLDSEIDLSDCVISESAGHKLMVRSKIGGFRIVLSLVTGLPCAYLIYILLNASAYSTAAVVTAVVFSPFLAAATALFAFAETAKTFDRAAHKAHLSFRIFGFARGKSVNMPETGGVRLWSEWGNRWERFIGFDLLWESVDDPVAYRREYRGRGV